MLIPGFIIESATAVIQAIKGQGIKLYGSSSGYAGIKPAAAAGSTIWQLPTADGTPNQVLKTDGSANLSFTTASGGPTGQQILQGGW